MKELTITAPEGYEIDKEKSTFEKIVFKPVSKYPTKLEEINRPWYIASGGEIEKQYDLDTINHFISKERAEEVLALIQLLAFRDAVWEIDGWKPDWKDGNRKYCITFEYGEFEIVSVGIISHVLAFKTAETADWFFKTHSELIIKAQNLL